MWLKPSWLKATANLRKAPLRLVSIMAFKAICMKKTISIDALIVGSTVEEQEDSTDAGSPLLNSDTDFGRVISPFDDTGMNGVVHATSMPPGLVADVLGSRQGEGTLTELRYADAADRARERLLAQARLLCCPVKVRMPSYGQPAMLPKFDRFTPLKKRSVFGAFANHAMTVMESGAQPCEPMIKLPSSFLLEEPVISLVVVDANSGF